MGKEKSHWDEVYSTKPPEKQSWTQGRPSPSIDWILESVPDRNAGIIDVGGGSSQLIDCLLEAGYKRPAVLDISKAALDLARARLGSKASLVDWIETDITLFAPERRFSLWHDRAVFHFLTKIEDRRRYVAALKKALADGGRAIISTFSPSGPAQCSGLDVMRFDTKAISQELGADFRLIREVRVKHTTPWGADQEFQYCEFQL